MADCRLCCVSPLDIANRPLPVVFWAAALYAIMLTFYRIMLISFVNSLQQQTNFSWRPYVTSAFMMHGLTAITDIVANIVGGVSKLPLAKFIDIVGRPHGFLLCLMFIVACKSFHSKSPNILRRNSWIRSSRAKPRRSSRLFSLSCQR